MSEIQINDILEELMDENQRLLNELLFAEQCLKKFNELKTFSQFIFIRLNNYLNPNECQIFKDLTQDIDNKFAEKTMNYREMYNLQTIGNSPQMSTLDENRELISREVIIFKTEDINNEDGLKSDEDYEPEVNLISDSEDEDVAIDRVFKCLEHDCQQTFKQNIDLFEHQSTFHPNMKKFVCDVPDCGHRAVSPSALRLHKMCVHSESAAMLVECQEAGCGKVFKSKRYLRKHTRRCHTNEFRPKPVKPKPNLDKILECDVPGCEFKTTRPEYLKQHKRNVHSTGGSFECTFEGCGKTFKSYRYRYKHEKTHNQESFLCKFEGCGKVFRLGYLKDHEKTHYQTIGEYRVKQKKTKFCKEPGCKFASHSNVFVERHRRSVHSNERPFECEICHKRFKLAHHLQGHMRTHMENTNIFQCDWPGCDYTAIQSVNIEKHKSYIHSDVRNFKCDWPECDKAYKSKADLKTHQKRHRDDRLYPCSWPGCNYRSYDSTTLNNHMRSHTNERPFGCNSPGCQWKFPTKTGLLKHQKTHNKIRLRTCTKRTSSSHYSNTNLNS